MPLAVLDGSGAASTGTSWPASAPLRSSSPIRRHASLSPHDARAFHVFEAASKKAGKRFGEGRIRSVTSYPVFDPRTKRDGLEGRILAAAEVAAPRRARALPAILACASPGNARSRQLAEFEQLTN